MASGTCMECGDPIEGIDEGSHGICPKCAKLPKYQTSAPENDYQRRLREEQERRDEQMRRKREGR